MRMHHGLSSLPVEGHLDCFQIWVIINIVVIIFVYKLLCEHRFSFFFNKYLEMELLSHMIKYLYKKLSNCFLKCLYWFGFIPVIFENFICSAFLSTLDIISFVSLILAILINGYLLPLNVQFAL